jgi:hypothetical protein
MMAQLFLGSLLAWPVMPQTTWIMSKAKLLVCRPCALSQEMTGHMHMTEVAGGMSMGAQLRRLAQDLMVLAAVEGKLGPAMR